MSAVVYPTKILKYFSNVVDPGKAQQLHSFCITRSICHVATLINGQATIINVTAFHEGSVYYYYGYCFLGAWKITSLCKKG